MGTGVLVIGERGSGKTTSLRNFERNEIMIFGLHKTHLNFKKKLNYVCLTNMSYSERYEYIQDRMLKYQDKCKVFVIDDSDALMFREKNQRRNEGGYNKFSDIGNHMMDLKDFVNTLNDDVIVYFLNHVETDQTTGITKAITAGKMISNQLGVFEAMFENVLLCTIHEGKHVFVTHSDGFSTAKTCWEMFEEDEIDNDLKAVDRVIRDYYDLTNPYESEVAE